MPILSWYDDKTDTKLLDYIPFLVELAKVPDVRQVIPRIVKNHEFEVENGIKVC